MLGKRIEETSIHSGIERSPQFAMVIIGQGNKTKRLQMGVIEPARWLQHFGHAVNGARSGVEGDFDEISGGELLLQLQQSAIDGNGL